MELIIIVCLSVICSSRAVNIEKLETGFIFETAGKAYVEKSLLKIVTQQPLHELQDTLSQIMQNKKEIMKACNVSKLNDDENCVQVEIDLNSKLDELDELLGLIWESGPRKTRGIEEVALGIFNLEIIDPTRIENVKRLGSNQALLSTHIEENSRAINDEIEVINTMESSIRDQSKIFTAAFERSNAIMSTVKQEFNTLRSQVSIFMALDWLLPIFHENMAKFKSFLLEILGTIGTTTAVSYHRVQILLKNQTSWLDLQSRLGKYYRIAYEDLIMSTRLENNQLIREFTFKILHPYEFALIRVTPVPMIEKDEIFIPDSKAHWTLVTRKGNFYYTSMTQDLCKPIIDGYICKVQYLSILANSTDCAIKHIFNNNHFDCSHSKLFLKKGYFQKLLSGSFLFVKPTSSMLYIKCDNATSRIEIREVGIITLPVGCSFVEENILFDSPASEQQALTIHYKKVEKIKVNSNKFEIHQPESPLVLTSVHDHLSLHLKKIDDPYFHEKLLSLMPMGTAVGIPVSIVVVLFLIVFCLYKTGCLRCINLCCGKSFHKKVEKSELKEVHVPKGSGKRLSETEKVVHSRLDSIEITSQKPWAGLLKNKPGLIGEGNRSRSFESIRNNGNN